MSLDFLSLDNPPDPKDWDELSSWGDWRDLLTEDGMTASHHYTADVLAMLRGIPDAHAGLAEIGSLLLVNSVREALRVAVCVLRLEETGALERVGTSTWQAARG
jgi:hypothetical protein